MPRTRRGEDHHVLGHVGSHVLHSRTALQCASYGGFADTMSLLLEAQADPNLQDNEVRSMLTNVALTIGSAIRNGNFVAINIGGFNVIQLHNYKSCACI